MAGSVGRSQTVALESASLNQKGRCCELENFSPQPGGRSRTAGTAGAGRSHVVSPLSPTQYVLPVDLLTRSDQPGGRAAAGAVGALVTVGRDHEVMPVCSFLQ